MQQLDPWISQRIVDEAPEAILVADREGTIAFWNSRLR
jgi:PAS domain-containing protein